MGLLDGLFGNNDNQQRRGGGFNDEHGANDFVNRYMNGHPADGISDDETYNNYQQVSNQLSPEEYELSAEEAFSRMSPDERRQFAQMLSQQTRAQGLDFPDLNGDGVDDRLQDPRALARAVGTMQRQKPGLLGQLFGGGGSSFGLGQTMGGMGGLGGLSSGSGMGGMASGMGGGGGMMQSPVAKAAMAGIAAFAVKRVLSNRMRRGA